MNQVAEIQESTYDYSIVTVDQLILIWDGIKKMLEKSERSEGTEGPEGSRGSEGPEESMERTI